MIKAPINQAVIQAFVAQTAMMNGPRGGSVGSLQTDGETLIYHGSAIVGRGSTFNWIDLHGWGHSPCTRDRINAGLAALGSPWSVYMDLGRVVLGYGTILVMMPDRGRVDVSGNPLETLDTAKVCPNNRQVRRWLGPGCGRIASITAEPGSYGNFRVKTRDHGRVYSSIVGRTA
jgi:hypothetical protein